MNTTTLDKTTRAELLALLKDNEVSYTVTVSDCDNGVKPLTHNDIQCTYNDIARGFGVDLNNMPRGVKL